MEKIEAMLDERSRHQLRRIDLILQE